jgi:TM2 domain-containing membrane protein YozV
MTEKAGKSKVVAGLLAIFLGGFGAHRFYLGQPKLALLYIAGLFVGGISVLVGIFEGFRYLIISDTKFAEGLRVDESTPAPLQGMPQVEQEDSLLMNQNDRPKSTYVAQVKTEKFDLLLRERDMKVVRRHYATTFKQALDTSIVNAAEGEFTVDLDSISGVKLVSATDDKMSWGLFNGKLFFIPSHQVNRKSPITRVQGNLEFDFTKSSEARVRAFVSEFEAQRDKLRASVQEKPTASSSQSLSGELREMAELRDAGLLTDEEFERAKRKLLEG